MTVAGALVAVTTPNVVAAAPISRASSRSAPLVVAQAGNRLAATSAAAAPAWDRRFGLQGTDGAVTAVTYAGSDAYIGGDFVSVAGMPTSSFAHVAHWTGGGFVPMGTGLNGTVNAIAVIGSKVYVGGTFTTAGGKPARHLAVWNGLWWAPVGSGVATDPSLPIPEDVEALATDGTHLFLGGQFDHAGGVPAMSVASYDPATGKFSPLGAGIQTCTSCGKTRPGRVRALLDVAGQLYAGGTYEQAGAVLTSSFARWNGSGWTSYGSGVLTAAQTTGTVAAVAVDPGSGAIYVGGQFDSAGGVAAKSLAKLTGTSWAGAGNITDGFGSASMVRGLAFTGGALYAGGDFSVAGGGLAAHLAVQHGSVWSQVGAGVDGAVEALAVTNQGSVAVGGSFDRSGSVFLANLATWGTGRWGTFGQGVQSANQTVDSIHALSVIGSGTYAGGHFLQVGGVPVSSIARWDGTAWHTVGTGLTLSGGGVGTVNAMAQIGNNLYVGGSFDTAGGKPAHNIARWDGWSWQPLGGGLTGDLGIVHALTAVNGRLYAGGSFSVAGSASAHDLAVWDPATGKWHPLSSNPVYDNGEVFTLTAYQTELFVGGNFSSLTTGSTTSLTQNLVEYDTNNTSTAPQAGYRDFGGVNGNVNALAVTAAGDLYVAGAFGSAGTGPGRTGIPAANIAVWHGGGAGNWEALALGLDGPASSVATVGSTVFAGGAFANAGGHAAPAIASYTSADSTWHAMGQGFAVQATRGGALDVSALAQSNPAGLFVGGHFVQSGSTAAGSLALWPATKV
ncbi:MAG: hypothetical protein JWN46_136 [Acidimicrobiales bacterium]|nr:hypothetical protein [Acidimicrobiales bacterium]